jgi:hypothetical protein
MEETKDLGLLDGDLFNRFMKVVVYKNTGWLQNKEV